MAATLNPYPVIHEVNSTDSLGAGVHFLAGRITGGGAHGVTVETKLKKILACFVKADGATALIAHTIAASTAYPGTEKVSFTLTAATYQYFIVGVLHREPTVHSSGGSVTVTYNPITGDSTTTE